LGFAAAALVAYLIAQATVGKDRLRNDNSPG
jgi:hypothetical protein